MNNLEEKRERMLSMIAEWWILRFDLCQSFRSDGASYYGSNDATLYPSYEVHIALDRIRL